jgi:anti-sigma-K factor RskA
MMTLTATGGRAPVAHMFWDRAHNTWTLVAHNMPELKPGRTYQLWLVTADQKISAGTFEPRDGDAMMRATYALADPLMALAVTEEPAGGMPQPTGAMVMVANAH